MGFRKTIFKQPEAGTQIVLRREERAAYRYTYCVPYTGYFTHEITRWISDAQTRDSRTCGPRYVFGLVVILVCLRMAVDELKLYDGHR